MAVKVLVVDDSSFFRRRVSEIITQDPMLTVIDTAQNGREAVDKAIQLRPDVITMDIEMPVMDGISAVREIMAKCPTPILMFSSLTHEGPRRRWMRWMPGRSISCPRNLKISPVTRMKPFACCSSESRRFLASVS